MGVQSRVARVHRSGLELRASSSVANWNCWTNTVPISSAFLERQALLEEWYRYSDKQEAKVLAEWSEAEGFKLGL